MIWFVRGLLDELNPLRFHQVSTIHTAHGIEQGITEWLFLVFGGVLDDGINHCLSIIRYHGARPLAIDYANIAAGICQRGGRSTCMVYQCDLVCFAID